MPGWLKSFVLILSTPSVHSSFTQNAILLNPKAFSCLNNKGVGASDILKREEVEMGQLVPGEVEVLARPSVPVVPKKKTKIR